MMILSGPPTTTTTTALLILQLLCQIGLSSAASSSTIQQGQTLKDWETLESPNSLFRLKFHTAGPLNSRYLVISFNTEWGFDDNPLWIANRNSPLSDSAGLLSIDRNGTFRLEKANHSVSIVFYSPADPDQVSRILSNSTTVSAMLLDNGNFVLRERSWSSGYERLLWQSFDYPTNTLLPGMKLSINPRTGQRNFLTSWLSDTVPYSGAFTLGINPNNTKELLIQRRGVAYWRSGAWTGNGFNLSPPLPADFYYPRRFTYNDVSSEDKYFTLTGNTNDSVMGWVLSSMGELRCYYASLDRGSSIGTWIPDCRGSDGGIEQAGCETLKLPDCRTGGLEQFQKKIGTFNINDYFMITSREEFDRNVSVSDCENKCIRNCSCFAYATFSPTDHVGCRFWPNGVIFRESDNDEDVVYVLDKRHPAMKWWMWFLIAVAVALVLFVVVILSYLRWKRIKPFGPIEKLTHGGGDGKASQENPLLQLGTTSPSEDSEQHPDFQLFSFGSLSSATNDFSSENKLGEGGFGPVYKGRLLEGQDIAVKRLSKHSGQGLKEFKNEIVVIAKLQHMNLVRLLGCCVEGEERMLIYEYMPNKSLDSLIFDPVGRELLDWNRRFSIIEGVAQGLVYLHKYSRLRIIHRDLKPSNILLDAEMNPKISDFGTARIFGQSDSSTTRRIIGTYGYMSPEYAMEGIFSVKSDVFSFGVLLLEIVSGRKNTSFNQFDSHFNLIGYAWELWQRNSAVELMDPLVAATSCPPSSRSFLRCIHVGLLCVQERAVDRPTMLEVVTMFANESMLLPSPKQPAFSTGESLMELPQTSSVDPEIVSRNNITISTLSGR